MSLSLVGGADCLPGTPPEVSGCGGVPFAIGQTRVVWQMFGPESTTWSFGDSSHVVENQRDLILSGTNSARADIWFFGRHACDVRGIRPPAVKVVHLSAWTSHV
jgi:hypothetical protein